ncbi:MAG: DUF3039 domain-containing protein [Acidimicrobiales bacterium]
MSSVETAPSITGPDTDRVLDDGGDHDRFAHYVRKDRIVPSAVEGTPVIALCGKKWVPSRNPDRHPVCPECKEIFEQLSDG